MWLHVGVWWQDGERFYAKRAFTWKVVGAGCQEGQISEGSTNIHTRLSDAEGEGPAPEQDDSQSTVSPTASLTSTHR
jgi:hypothetical protein